MSRYANIKLGRVLRPFVLAELRALPTWESYRVSQNIPSNGPHDVDAIRLACEALGYDLRAARSRCFAPAAAAPAAMAAAATSMGAVLTPAAPFPPAPSFAAMAAADVAALPGNTGDDEDDSEGSEGEMNEEGTQEAQEGTQEAGEAFEGRDPTQVIEGALASVSAHLTPWLQATLPAVLLPLASAAVRGPRIVTERAPAALPLGMVSTKPVAWVKPAKAFGLSGAGRNAVLSNGDAIAVCDHPAAPRIDPDYVWTPGVLASLVACDVKGLNLWAYGPAGTGKTESAEQYAARTKRPFVRIAIDRATEPDQIIGQWVLDAAGGMRWQDGKLTAAFRQPYCVILIDEPTLMRAGALAIFQTALDQRRLYLPGGEVVEAAQGIFVIAADNTSGVGDDTGRYVDTSATNAAFLDRFALRVAYTHLSPAVEAGMICKRTRLPLAACRIMSDFAALTRRDVDAGKLTMGLTPRRLLAWAHVVCAGMPSADAFAGAVLQGTAPEDIEALRMLATTSLVSQHPNIDALARGDKPAAPTTPAEEAIPSRAGSRFPSDTTDETL
jgi:hypothetical protein